MRKITAVTFIAFMIIQNGCATSFTGNAKIPGGPRGCQNICSHWGMRMTGMVALGEYTDGCVCSVPGQQASAEDISRTIAIAGGSAAGVVMQSKQQSQSAKRR